MVCRLLIFFSNSSSTKYSFRYTVRVSNSLYKDQTRYFVRSDLGPNCLQGLSADNTSSKKRCKVGVVFRNG